MQNVLQMKAHTFTNPVCSCVCSLVQVVGKCLADGADEYLQMLSLCSVIMQQASQNN